MTSNLRTSSPYQSQYKQSLQTPPKAGQASDIGTAKKDYNPDYSTHEETKNKLHETVVHKAILDQENGNLKQDVEFWQGKVGHAENEKHLQLELKDQTHRSQLEVLKRTHDNQLNLHQTEIDRLKDHIHERESRIGELASELKARIEENDRLKLDNGAKDAELFRAQREINDLKQIADFKTGENEKLRNDKSELQLALYNSQQSENALKDNEQKLFGQLQALRDTLQKLEQDNKDAHAIKDHNHGNQIQGMHLQHTNEKEALSGEIGKHVALGQQKDADIADLKNKLNGILGELANSQKNHQNSANEANLWRDKHGQSEADRSHQLEQARQLRDATVDKLSRNHSIEKQGLQNRISSLNNALVNKEGELSNTKNAWVATENNKRNLELAKATLEVQLKDWMRKKDEADRNYQNQLKIQNDIHSNNIKNQQQQNQRDKELLANQIAGLRNVVDNKHKELNDARTNAHMNAIRASENDKKFRDASAEAECWKSNADRINREKSQEVDAAHSLRNSQIAGLQRQHNDQLTREAAEKEALRGVIGQKHQEAEQFKGIAGQLGNDLKNKEDQANRHFCDSQAWKSKAEQEANLRNHLSSEAESHKAQLRGIIVDKEKEANDLKQSQIRLQGDLYNTQQHASRKEQEAEAWRSKAADEQKQRSIDRGLQDDIHRNNAAKMRDSHEAEKAHLHDNISELHGHVQKKQQEAADWRRSYHAHRYGNK